MVGKSQKRQQINTNTKTNIFTYALPRLPTQNVLLRAMLNKWYADVKYVNYVITSWSVNSEKADRQMIMIHFKYI